MELERRVVAQPDDVIVLDGHAEAWRLRGNRAVVTEAATAGNPSTRFAAGATADQPGRVARPGSGKGAAELPSNRGKVLRRTVARSVAYSTRCVQRCRPIPGPLGQTRNDKVLPATPLRSSSLTCVPLVLLRSVQKNASHLVVLADSRVRAQWKLLTANQGDHAIPGPDPRGESQTGRSQAGRCQKGSG